jgi:Na+/H+-dicarboxylate symporter
MSKNKNRMLWYVLASIALALIIGPLVGPNKAIFHVKWVSIFDLGGQLFLNALSLLIAPLVVVSLIHGTSHIGANDFKRVGLRALLTFFSINLFALVLGFVLVNLASPLWETSTKALAPQFTSLIKETPSLVDIQPEKMLLQFIPSNFIDAFSKNQIIGLILFSLLFGYSITKLSATNAATLKNLFSELFQVLINMTNIILIALPIGVFFLVAKQSALTGFEAIKPLLIFSFFTLVTLACLVIVLFWFLKTYTKLSPRAFIKSMSPAYLTAFSTSSSAATLPITINCLEKNVGISKPITNLVMPLATSLNLAASGLYSFLAVYFITSIYDVHLTLIQQILVLLIAFITTLGEAGIPSASIFVVLILLKSLNLPLEAIGLLFITDRFMDMFRTLTNVICASISTAIVAKTENK